MSEDWRDEPLTKGEMYDALMGAHAKIEKATKIVDASINKTLRWRQPLLNVARYCIEVSLDVPLQIAKKLSGEK